MTKEYQDDWDIVFKYWQQGDLSCAFETCRMFTNKYPEIVNGWVVYADILSEYSKFSDALSALQNAGKLSNGKSNYNIENQYGHIYRKQGDLKTALKWYKKSLNKNKTVETYNFIGSCYSKLGNFQKAKKYLLNSIDLVKGNHDESYYNLGLIARAEGEYIKAKGYFKKSIALESEYQIAIDANNVTNVIDLLDTNKSKLNLVK